MTRKDDASFLLDTRAKTLAEREEEFISCHYFLNILPHTQVTILNPITSFVLALFLYYIYVFHGVLPRHEDPFSGRYFVSYFERTIAVAAMT